MDRRSDPSIVLLIPCYNEERSIGKVIADFRRELPALPIVVLDNNSTDRTAEIARDAGAMVLTVRKQGKGHAVRAAFQQVDADIYIMVDGDATYEPCAVHELLELVTSGQADMAVGRRVTSDPQGAYRPLHRFGNKLVGRLIATLFRTNLMDIMSGYRVFTREVVRATPLVSRGFEIETELTVQALGQDFIIMERDAAYYAREPGSVSKLNTYRDGARVLWTILSLFMAYKPLTFFGLVGLLQMAVAICLAGIPLIRVAFTSAPASMYDARFLWAGFLGVSGLSFVVLGIVLTNINNRFMALTSLLTRGRLAEPPAGRTRVPRSEDPTQPQSR